MRSMNQSPITISPDDRPSAFSAQPEPRLHLKLRPKAIRIQHADEAKPKARPKRRRFRGPVLSTVQKVAVGGVLFTAVIMGSLVLWRSGWPQRNVAAMLDQVVEFSADAGFKVNDVSVTGRGRTPPSDILSALRVERGDSILAVDLDEVKSRLENIPSVQTAIVERRLPDALRVTITERRPVALWQHDDTFQLVDRNGHPFPGSVDGFQHLPLVVGEGAPLASAELFQLLQKEPSLAPRVKAAIRVSNRRWNLRLDDAQHGLEARLPENDLEGALHHLAQLESNRSLSSRHVDMVDLRVADRMVVKTAPEQTATSPTPQKGGG